MKNFMSILVVVLVIVFSTTAFVSSKYDKIMRDPSIKKMEQIYQQVRNNKVLYDYMNLLVNRNELLRLVKEGRFDSEKSKFISAHVDFLTSYLHMRIISTFILKLKPQPQDSQYIYVIGVIKDPHAQVAKNGVEYEQEKAFLRNMPLYFLWEQWHEPGYIEKIVNEEIDLLYK